MSTEIVVALIGATATVLVAGATLGKQVLADRKADRVARLEAAQGINEALLGEYRHLLTEHRTDLDRERAEHDQTRALLDGERAAHRDTRRQFEHATRVLDQLLQARES